MNQKDLQSPSIKEWPTADANGDYNFPTGETIRGIDFYQDTTLKFTSISDVTRTRFFAAGTRYPMQIKKVFGASTGSTFTNDITDLDALS